MFYLWNLWFTMYKQKKLGSSSKGSQWNIRRIWMWIVSTLCLHTSNKARNLRRHYVSYHNIVPAIYLQHPRLLLVKHKCDVCDKEFDRKDSLVRHKKMKTCSFLSCDYCKFMCSDKTSFIAHTKILHIKCDHCNFRIIFKRSLVRHIKNVHVNL